MPIGPSSTHIEEPTTPGSGTPCTVTANSLQYNNAGAFGCVTEFTYALSTITAAAAGKVDLSPANTNTSFKVPTFAGAAPTVQGAVAYDTTQDTLMRGGSGAIKGATPRVLAVFVCNSTVCTCTGTGCTAGTFTSNCISGGADANCTNAGTTETNFGMNFSIPANFFIANKILHVTWGVEHTSSAASPSFRHRMKLGTTVLFDSAAAFDGDSIAAEGGGGEFYIQGTAAPGAAVNLETVRTAWYGRAVIGGGNGNIVAQPVAVATNAAQTLQFSLQLGAATAGNFFRMRQMVIEELN